MLWNGEKISAFERGVGIVSKDLLNVSSGYLRQYFRVDFDGFYGKGPGQSDRTRRFRTPVTGTGDDHALGGRAGGRQEKYCN
jgi:hypothetical protein